MYYKNIIILSSIDFFFNLIFLPSLTKYVFM
jgi:hypothetical protein